MHKPFYICVQPNVDVNCNLPFVNYQLMVTVTVNLTINSSVCALLTEKAECPINTAVLAMPTCTIMHCTQALLRL